MGNSRVVGGAQTLSKRADRFPGTYPRSLFSGSGARVMDASGRPYIDWIAALGAISLGYGDMEVDGAVADQVEDGPIFSLSNVGLEEAVAEQLCDLIPCAETVRFLKTGSEATEAAIRVARAYTGRDVILTCGYHGWGSWYAATRTYCPGVPDAMKLLVGTFQYNDLASLDAAIARAGEQCEIRAEDHNGIRPALRWRPGVAAIIMEPTIFDRPASGYLEGVRERATRIGAVLIFDEMVTGFRWHAGGYQALCGVTPDLATYGKGMANGYPMAALVGRRDIMRHATLVSGTFGGDCIGLAAARATLARYQQGGVCAHMWWIGRALQDGYNALATELGVPTRMEGQPPHPVIRWEEEHAREDGPVNPRIMGREPVLVPNRHRASLFFQETVKRGVLFHPDVVNVMLAHTDEDVRTTLDACREAMFIVRSAIETGTVRERIVGDPISPEPPWRSAS